MINPTTISAWPRFLASRSGMMIRLVCAAFLASVACGCAAISSPVANGIPVRSLPIELMAEPKEDRQTIPLNLLGQQPPADYRLGAGDVLGVWIETVLGESNQLPPVTPAPQTGYLARLPPAVGYPIAVRSNGTIRLPLIKPVKVDGMTLDEAEEAVRRAYTIDNQILKPGQDRILLTLARPRLYHVMVVRQDSGAVTVSAGVLGGAKKGTGQALDLPAYENDVLNALALSGGLPGIDAVNEVVIERAGFDPEQPDLATVGGRLPSPGHCVVAAGKSSRITRIPLRLRPGETMPFTPEDVVLHTGDVVFIEARETELWYSGGLLSPSEHFLPRDHDLDVLEAVSQAGLPLVTGGITLNNLSGSITQTGLGFPPPSRLTVVRRTPNGGQIPIQVDLNLALRDPRERLLVQSGDILILQFSPAEALAFYLSQKFNINASWQYLHGAHETGTANGTLP